MSEQEAGRRECNHTALWAFASLVCWLVALAGNSSVAFGLATIWLLLSVLTFGFALGRYSARVK